MARGSKARLEIRQAKLKDVRAIAAGRAHSVAVRADGSIVQWGRPFAEGAPAPPAGLGPVTAIPLILYGNGAKLLRLSTIAILQYIAPTMILITAVFWFGEDFDTPRRIAFGLIWLALGLYSASLWRGRGAFTAP